MITTIIAIGNSKGIRIPKVLLEESGLENKVELLVKRGEITIKPVKENRNETLALSEQTLAKDWNNPEEDEAWSSLQ